MYSALKVSGGGGDPEITIRGYITSHATGVRTEIFRGFIDTAVENHQELKPPHPFVVSGGYMVEFQASTTIANTAVSLRFSLIEVKNL